MVELRNLDKVADSITASGGLAQQKGRTVMNRRVTWCTVTITIVSTLLVGLLATAVVARVFSLAPARGVAGQERVTQENPDADAYAMAAALAVADNAAAFCPGDCQLGRAGEASMTGGATGSAARAAAAAAGVGHLEFSPGDAVAGAIHAASGAAESGLQEFLAGDRATRGLPSVQLGTGVGDFEYSPGEEPSVLPSPAPNREAVPDFGRQP